MNHSSVELIVLTCVSVAGLARYNDCSNETLQVSTIGSEQMHHGTIQFLLVKEDLPRLRHPNPYFGR